MHKIIIVEDEEIIRNGLAISFEWMDYGCNIVGLAKDGKEGLDMILKLNPDIVISDIKMPKMNGIEMIQNAKLQGKDFFSIILTSYAEFGYAKSAIEFGASGYLLKPVDEDELTELLKSITEKINKNNRQKKIEESVKDKIIEKEDDWKIFLKAGESSDSIIRSVYDIIQSKYTVYSSQREYEGHGKVLPVTIRWQQSTSQFHAPPTSQLFFLAHLIYDLAGGLGNSLIP